MYKEAGEDMDHVLLQCGLTMIQWDMFRSFGTSLAMPKNYERVPNGEMGDGGKDAGHGMWFNSR